MLSSKSRVMRVIGSLVAIVKRATTAFPALLSIFFNEAQYIGFMWLETSVIELLLGPK
ncbi:hypothetical protein D3C76_1751820 [compost metagenome]